MLKKKMEDLNVFFLINKKLKFGNKENYIYAFDNGVIINGLVNLYNKTKIKKYLYAAEKSADFLILNFLKIKVRLNSCL